MKNLHREEINRAMIVLYEDARREREQMRKDFNPKEYEWHVSSIIFKHLQVLIESYNILEYSSMYAFDIKVVCCPFLDGIELVHRIGGIEL